MMGRRTKCHVGWKAVPFQVLASNSVDDLKRQATSQQHFARVARKKH